jgi:hypothetical protein
VSTTDLHNNFFCLIVLDLLNILDVLNVLHHISNSDFLNISNHNQYSKSYEYLNSHQSRRSSIEPDRITNPDRSNELDRIIEPDHINVPNCINIRSTVTFYHTVPTLMHVCEEAREEGKRIYEKRDYTSFECMDIGDNRRYAWFHPQVDIAYFVRSACMPSFKQFLSNNPGIANLAISPLMPCDTACPSCKSCCETCKNVHPTLQLGMRREKFCGHAICMAVEEFLGNDGRIDLVEGLHSVKELFLVVRVDRSLYGPRELHPTISLGPLASEARMEYGDDSGIEMLEGRIIIDYKDGERGDIVCNKPKIRYSYVSLAPPIQERKDGNIRSCDVEVPKWGSSFAVLNRRSFIEILRHTGCTIGISDSRYLPGDDPVIITIFGATDEAVNEVKTAIEKRVSEQEQRRSSGLEFLADEHDEDHENTSRFIFRVPSVGDSAPSNPLERPKRKHGF